MNHRIEFRLSREPWGRDAISIRIAQTRATKNIEQIFFAQPIEFKLLTPEEEGTIQPPTLPISFESAQQLMDELWQIGIRPTNGAGSVGQLAATEKHLEDMRVLAFHRSGAQKP